MKRLQPFFFLFCFTLLFLSVVQANGQQRLFSHLTVENGLPGSSIIAIAQDADGFMWYGTQNNGLSKYDGVHFTNYISQPGQAGSLSGNTVSSLLRASDGRLWIGTSRGIDIYNRRTDNFERIPSRLLGDSTIYSLYEDSDKNIWVGTKKGLYLLTDKTHFTFKLITGANAQNPNGRSIRCMYEDQEKNLWIGTQSGLLRIRDRKQPFKIEEYSYDTNPGSLSGNYITSITEDAAHQLWIGTHDNGLNRYDRQTNTFKHYLQGPNSISNNSVRKLRVDKNGDLWIGTQEGLTIFNGKTGQFTSYLHHPQDGNSISNNSIHSIYQDANRNIWIGTYFGGVNVCYAYNTPFEVYQHTEFGSSISNNVVSSITEDESHNLWIGTEGGGLNYYNRQTGNFTTYRNDPHDPHTLSSNLVKKVYRDSRQNIWVGLAYNKGLNRLDTKQKTFQRFTIPQKDVNTYDEISAILEDSYGQLWVGSQNGLHQVVKDGNTYNSVLRTTAYPLLQGKDVHSLYEDGNRNLWIGTSSGLYLLNRHSNSIAPAFANNNTLVTANINAVVADSEGSLWVATRNTGLIRWNAVTNALTHFTINEGLPDDNVLGVVEDDKKYVWLSTENGIAKWVRSSKSFIQYTTEDGLPGNKFNFNAFFKDAEGQLFFGGYNGLISFQPNAIETNHFTSPIRFTGLQLFNKPVAIGDDTHLLETTVATAPRLTLNHNQNVFTIDFALLNYIKPHKNRYAYKLDGFDKQWNATQNTAATYTNLPPGTYTFLLKAANNDGFWNAAQTSLTIQVNPPVWRTWWAYLLYSLLLAGVLFFVVRFFYLKALFRKEYELQQLKLNFFTNISHEIRTHLTLIMAPVEKLSAINKENNRATEMLRHIKTNASRLLELVTELMDFRKAETNNLPLHVSKHNISLLLQDAADSFSETAANRSIHFHFEYSSNTELYFDEKQMSKVFFNLLGNAFKFTPNGGRIQLTVKELPNEVQIKVTDNGKGIAPEDIQKIFTNYYQGSDSAAKDSGYGIGLALSKALTELHSGCLLVESRLATSNGEGYTCFTVLLRKGTAHFSKAHLAPLKPAFQNSRPLPESEEDGVLPDKNNKPVVLTVEDNNEVRHFIKEALEDAYTVLEADNGKTGLLIAFEQIPDIIISDVMMPEMDGLQFCQRLKTDERTSHIPVVLLTAKSAHEQQVEGWENGADSYITKPFSLNMLELQVRNLLAARATMRQKFSRQVMLEPQGIVLNNTDEQFLKRLMEIIEEQLCDPELGVVLLTEKLAMSKPVLYKKLKALTDMSVHDFIVSVRMKKAAQLLEQKQLTVSEIAYEVGYSDRKYFSKEFKKFFGKTPTEFVEDIRADTKVYE